MLKHILVVDDEASIRFALSRALERSGYRVSVAGDGEEALLMILRAEGRATPFDLILTDIQMPKMSGLELIRAIKAKGMTTPFLVSSGLRDREMIREFCTAGCSGILFKPFHLLELIEQIDNILRRNGKDHPFPYCSIERAETLF
jgi:two-component system response regulator PhoP